jgi:hypothetical protein
MTLGLGLGPKSGGAGFLIAEFGATVTPDCTKTGDLRMVADGSAFSSFTLNVPTGPACNFLMVVSVITSTVDLVLGTGVVKISGEWDSAVGAVNAILGQWDGTTLRITHIGPAVDIDPPDVLAAANAVHFNGTTTYLDVASLTAAVDGKLGILNAWVRVDRASVGTTRYIFTSSNGGNGGVLLWIDNSNNLNVNLRRPTFQDAVFFSETNGIFAVDGYVHVLASWDVRTATQRAEMYINDVLVTPTTLVDETIDYTPTSNWNVGGFNGGNSKFAGDVAELYLNSVETLDLSVEANRRKFRTASGQPVDLGPTGALPTGTAPIVFMSGPTVDWHTNKGTGGGFTENGALTDASEGI